MPGRAFAGKVDLKEIYEIARVKQTDPHLEHISLEGLCRSVISTAQSVGIEVVQKK